jgi:hypothetical protein
MVMKQSQWIIAAVVLAAMVFIVTFAMNYLGFTPTRKTPGSTREALEVTFFWKEAPFGGHGGIETEEKATGHQDFWFRNDNEKPVKVELKRTSCKCTAVELFLLPEQATERLLSDAVALFGVGSGGRTAALALHCLALPEMQKGALGPAELLRDKESVSVPAGAVGWVRMSWKAEKLGRQIQEAELWMDGKDVGKSARLETRVRFHEALRVNPTLALGLLRDEELVAGVTKHIVCWSSTRPSFRLEARAGLLRGKAASDPFVVGKPERLGPEEVLALQKANNDPDTGSQGSEGQVLCAYRIPVTLLAVSPDKTTPFDIGPFHRGVILSSPDVAAEPKHVTVTGRVRGAVEIGNDEEGGVLNFSSFPKTRGKRQSINLQSDVPGLTLEFDRQRTPRFLSATLGKPEKLDGSGQTWKLHAEVLPGQASGVFPRREDPAYEDSAVYLKAIAPGKPVRTVRIGVQGTANES